MLLLGYACTVLGNSQYCLCQVVYTLAVVRAVCEYAGQELILMQLLACGVEYVVLYELREHGHGVFASLYHIGMLQHLVHILKAEGVVLLAPSSCVHLYNYLYQREYGRVRQRVAHCNVHGLEVVAVCLLGNCMEHGFEHGLVAQHDGGLDILLGEVSVKPLRYIACLDAVCRCRDYSDVLWTA